MRWDKNYSQPEVINDPTVIPAYGVTDVERAYWNAKQEALEYDRYPTLRSDKHCTSGVIHRALEDYKTSAVELSQAFFWGQVGGLAQTKEACEAAADNAAASALNASQSASDAATIKNEVASYVDVVSNYATAALNYSTNSYNSSLNAASSANTAAQESLKAQNFSQDSEAWAVGERGGYPVSSDDPTYHNNAKYYVDGISIELDKKVDKVAGKGLSTNDYTDAEKTKLAGLSNYDDTAIKARVSTIEGEIPSAASPSNKLVDTSTLRSAVTATSDLIKDTTGWIGKNQFNGKSATKTAQGVTWTVNESDNNIVTVSGTPTGFEAFTADSKKVLPVGDYVLSGISDMVNVVYNAVFLYKGNTQVRDLHIQDNNAPRTFSILQSDNYDTIRVQLKRQTNGVACSGTGKIMITTPEQYALNPSYEPYHGAVDEVKADKTDVISLMNDTVGWVGGNILPIKLSEVKELNTSGIWSGNIYTINSVTFTFIEVNGYITEITVNGTPTSDISLFVTKPFSISAGRYVLTSNYIASNNFDFQLYHKTDSSDFDTPSIYTRADRMEGDLVDGNYHARIHVGKNYAVNNVVLKPMLLTKEQYVFNPAYRPYHESVEDWYWSENAKLGAHQLIPLVLTDLKAMNTTGTWTNNVYEINGVTLTCEEKDGYVIKITANGTPTGGNIWFLMNIWHSGLLDKGSYELLGCPTGGSSTSYQILFREDPQVTGGVFVATYGTTVPFTISDSSKRYVIFIGLLLGTPLSNKVFTPLIRYAGDTNSECTPYAITNAKLSSLVTRKVLTPSFDLNNIFKYGDYYWENVTPINAPESITYGSMRVYPCGDITYQEIIRGAGDRATIYLRRYQNSWSSWFKFTGTVVS